MNPERQGPASLPSFLPKGILAAPIDWLSQRMSRMGRARRLMSAGRRTKAFRLFAIEAERGRPEACLTVGRCYLAGSGVPTNWIEATRWLEKAAELNSVAAQSLLAGLYAQGVTGLGGMAGREIGPQRSGLFAAQSSIAPAFDKAALWARKAAEAGDAEAQALLGYILTTGPELQRDAAEAEKLYRLSAAADCARGHLGYALTLMQKAPEHRDYAAAVRHLVDAAEADLGAAQYLLGELAEEGLGMPADQTMAADLYRRAAGQNVHPAQRRWGDALVSGRGVAADPVEGQAWLRRAAKGGDSTAAARIGDLLIKADPPNHDEAAHWFRRAATAGHVGAMRALGLLYLAGTGVPQDVSEARRLLRVAAEGDDKQAVSDLASMALAGHATPEDKAFIFAWFQSKAEAGDLQAIYNLGLCFVHGIGTGASLETARLWLTQAVKHGHLEASIALQAMAATMTEAPASSSDDDRHSGETMRIYFP